jgi:hypothetical protein
MNEPSGSGPADRLADEIVKLMRNFQGPADLNDSALRAEARQELERSSHLLLDAHNMTPGMKAFCSRTFAKKYDDWQNLNKRFREAIEPHALALAKFDRIDDQIEKGVKNVTDAETIVLSRWKHGETYKQAKKDFELADKNFSDYSDGEKQRQPKVVGWMTTLLTLAVIGSVEWLINFEAFNATFGIEALAAGFTIAVALAVGVSSHWHGVMFKQWDHYFGDDVDPSAKRWYFAWLLFVTVALIAALIFVGWNRYIWAMEIIAKTSAGPGRIIVDTDSIQVNVIQKVAMSLIGNVIVWIVGTAFVYGLRDRNPDFADSFARRQKYRKTYMNYKKKIDNQIKAFVARQQRDIDTFETKRRSEEGRDVRVGHIAKMSFEVRQLNRRIESSLNGTLVTCMNKYRFAMFQEDIGRSAKYFKDGVPCSVDEFLTMPLDAELSEIIN